ncbi:MAG TPA: methionyl-tRNA formyltransferase [Clostridia bacterium]|nr:methionyl-tRNA formyltransferase [Clostridia bacterium]
MNLVFMGTSEFSLGILEHLAKEHNILAIVTRKDRLRGRGKKLLPPPVKVFAMERGIDYFQYLPKAEELKKYPADALIVAAYGKILPKELLELYAYGAINVHTSLLPKYRGASPIQTALINEEKTTGVSIMKMLEGMDTGPVYAQVEVPVGDLRYGELENKLMEKSLPALSKTLKELEKNTALAKAQKEELATYCGKISKSDCLVDWTDSAFKIEGLVRALWPNPMAYTLRKGERLLLHRVKAFDIDSTKSPGTVEKVTKEGIYVAAGQGLLRIEELQRPGKRALLAEDYLRGNPITENEILGGR